MKSDLKRLRKEKTFHEKSQKAFRGTWRTISHAHSQLINLYRSIMGYKLFF